MDGVQGLAWRIGRSVMMELQGIMIALFDRSSWAAIPDHVASFIDSVPHDWLAQGKRLSGAATALGLGANIAGVLQVDDYSQATLALRQLTVDRAIHRVEEYVTRYRGAEVVSAVEPVERLAQLTTVWMDQRYRTLGLLDAAGSLGVGPMGRRSRHLGYVLQGQPLHVEFWHWMDRFYFEIYAPWRKQQEVRTRAQEERACEALGATEGDALPPISDWLPQQNALALFPQIMRAVKGEGGTLLLWAQPLGLFDVCIPTPGGVLVSLGEPDEPMAALKELSQSIAAKAKALGDPTRLMILRLIRHFPMDNTQMAAFLDIARPTVSVHTKLLREAGLIETETGKGRSVMHRVDVDALRRMFDELLEFLTVSEVSARQDGE